jgi:hypothetical protein
MLLYLGIGRCSIAWSSGSFGICAWSAARRVVECRCILESKLRMTMSRASHPFQVRVSDQPQWLKSAIRMMMGIGTPSIQSKIERMISLLN